MLISFSAANFRSFRHEQTLSMVASKRLSAYHPEHCHPVPGAEVSLLPLVAMYGANGSGKSNWVKAVAFVRDLILAGTRPTERINRQPFQLDAESSGQPTSFEIRLVAGQRACSYGFTLSDTEVLTEWLALLEGEKETPIFERQTSPEGVVIEPGPVLSDAAYGNHQKIKALAGAGTLRNQLFLTAIHQNVDASQQGPLIQPVLAWFSRQLDFVFPNAYFKNLAELIFTNPMFCEFASAFLDQASTGISKLKVEAEEVRGDWMGIPAEVLRQMSPNQAQDELVRVFMPGGQEQVFIKTSDGKFRVPLLKAEHGQTAALPLNEESDGTIRLAHLLPALFQLKNQSRVFIIDEIDRSLHPLLSRKFVEFFLRICGASASQLLFTTHESNLLDLDLLRRDEIWFAEKKADGATEMYSLSDFQVRQDLRIQKGYLQGRFGAIPFLGSLDRLTEQLEKY